MNRSLIVTFTGPDRPGIVDRLSGIVADNGGNWEGSRLATLAGRFAGILQITIADEGADKLISALVALETEEFSVHVEPGSDADPRPDYVRLILEVSGLDHEGIVHDVSHVLARRGVNIEELNSEQFIAPMSGQLMFTTFAIVDAPPDVSIEALQSALEALAHDLMVTIDIPTDD
jgi:glycine cleavage system regulatory protein